MVTIGMNYHVISGKEAQFEGACRRVLDVMREVDGHDSSQIFRRIDGEESPEYLIVSRWTDEAAFRSFVASDAFKKVTNWGKEHILSGRPSHTIYRED
jgi:heme-degrading monooxygenase HmoA